MPKSTTISVQERCKRSSPGSEEQARTRLPVMAADLGYCLSRRGDVSSACLWASIVPLLGSDIDLCNASRCDCWNALETHSWLSR